eukprot:3468546-Pyramimonas_sp.AAC.1
MSLHIAPPRSPAEAQRRSWEYERATPAAKAEAKKKQDEASRAWSEAWAMFIDDAYEHEKDR